MVLESVDRRQSPCFSRNLERVRFPVWTGWDTIRDKPFHSSRSWLLSGLHLTTPSFGMWRWGGSEGERVSETRYLIRSSSLWLPSVSQNLNLNLFWFSLYEFSLGQPWTRTDVSMSKERSRVTPWFVVEVVLFVLTTSGRPLPFEILLSINSKCRVVRPVVLFGLYDLSRKRKHCYNRRRKFLLHHEELRNFRDIPPTICIKLPQCT